VYDTNHDKTTTSDLFGALVAADIIFLCVPSNIVPTVIPVIVESKTTAPLVIIAKGIDIASGKFPGELCDDAGLTRWALLYGPMIAEDVASRRHSFAMFASTDKTIFDIAAPLFLPHLHVYYTPDTHTIAFLGILKNVYSLGAGILEGLDAGDNVRGMYAVHVLHEMKEVVKRAGYSAGLVEGIAGLGDFIGTSTSFYSKNRKAGATLVRGRDPQVTSEGLLSVRRFCEKLDVCPPLLDTIRRIALQEADPEELVATVAETQVPPSLLK
jgi:glycerol-3-phosphate dehydrogenase (NAD(P)+)